MSELTTPPAGTCWVFARPSVPVQCCWCGHLFMPGDYAMFAIDPDEPERKWWSHYEEKPCYGTKPRPPRGAASGTHTGSRKGAR